jgi:hypothetical protein
LSKAGDNWKNFLVRNGFVSLTPEPVSDLPLCFDEPTDPFPSTHSLQDLHIELQVTEDPALPTETPVDSHQSIRDTHQRHKFVPKKSLEEVLDKLKGKVYVTPILGKIWLMKMKLKSRSRENRKHRGFRI